MTSADVDGVLAAVSFAVAEGADVEDVVDFRASCAAESPCPAAASNSVRSSGVITTSIVDVKSVFSLRWLISPTLYQRNLADLEHKLRKYSYDLRNHERPLDQSAISQSDSSPPPKIFENISCGSTIPSSALFIPFRPTLS